MANRYTNLTPSAYTPLTLEEIAMVPAMKRKQHEDVLAKQEAIRAGLAKVDPYSKHFDEAVRLKNDIESKMDTTAQELAQSGIDNNMIGKTIGLNREYQDLVAPTGKLGQINAEKININKINEDYDKLAAANHWSPAESNYWKDKALKEYNDLENNPVYDPETGRIKQYTGPENAPTRIDYSKKMDDYASKAKMSTSEFAQAAQSLARDEANGINIVTGNSSSKKYGNNYTAVLDAYKTMKREMNDPTSDVYKSMQYERRNPGDLLTTMAQQSEIYKQKVYGEEKGNTISVSGGGTKKEPVDGAGTIINNDTQLTSDAVEHKTYTDAHRYIQEIQAKGSGATAAEKAKLGDLIELRQDADAKLRANKEYAKVDTAYNTEIAKWKALASKMNLSPDEKASYASDPNLLPQLLFSKGVGAYLGDVKDPNFKLLQSDAGLSKINDIAKSKQTYKDEAWQSSSSMRHNYSYLPSTDKEQALFKNHNENIYNTLRGMPSISNVLQIQSIGTESGSRKDLTIDDGKNIQELLKNAEPGTFKVTNVKTYGDNRTPEVTFTFNTNKSASSYDLEGLEAGGDEYGGSEKPVTVTYKLKKFSNAFDTKSAKGYKALSGYMADFWKDKGEVNQLTGNFQGKEVSNAFIENQYAGVTTEELRERAKVDSDAREALMLRIAKNQASKKR